MSDRRTVDVSPDVGLVLKAIALVHSVDGCPILTS